MNIRQIECSKVKTLCLEGTEIENPFDADVFTVGETIHIDEYDTENCCSVVDEYVVTRIEYYGAEEYEVICTYCGGLN